MDTHDILTITLTGDTRLGKAQRQKTTKTAMGPSSGVMRIEFVCGWGRPIAAPTRAYQGSVGFR